jgi:hypothetical protein
VAVPRGFALVFGDLDAHGWAWRALSHRGPWSESKIIDHKTVTTERTAVKTVLGASHRTAGLALFALWVDGRWASGWGRHPADPAPVAIGARALRSLVTAETCWPRWERPDLEHDEGTPPAERWNPEITGRVLAGMQRVRDVARAQTERRTG